MNKCIKFRCIDALPSVQIFIFSMTYCRLQQLLLGLCICTVQITLYDLGRDENVKNVAA